MAEQDPKPTDATQETGPQQQPTASEDAAETTATEPTAAEKPASAQEPESKAAAKEQKPTAKPETKKQKQTEEKEASQNGEQTPPPPPAREPQPVSLPAGQHWFWGTGRRKASVARVRVRPGDGKFTVNGKPFTEYFTELRDHNDLNIVLEKTNTQGRIDVAVKAGGGGYTGQAGAVVLGLGRALLRYDPGLEPILRANNFLTRDPRKVERKKYGQPGARKQFQFSKR